MDLPTSAVQRLLAERDAAVEGMRALLGWQKHRAWCEVCSEGGEAWTGCEVGAAVIARVDGALLAAAALDIELGP